MPTVRDIISKLDARQAGLVFMLGLSVLCLLLQREVPGFAQGHHGRVSSHGMTLAGNLSLAQRGFTFDSARVGADGNVTRTPCNRLPPTSFLMIKTAMSLARGDMRLEILYARIVMMLFFLGSLVCAYLALCHLLHDALAATCASLLTFASWYLQQYNDVVFNYVPSLFGMLLCFHGMVVHTLYGRRLQLYVKALAAAGLGWQGPALLLPYAVCGLVRRAMERQRFPRAAFDHDVLATLAAFALAFGILALNAWNEMAVTGRKLAETSALRPAQSWTGDTESGTPEDEYGQYLSGGYFVRQQIYRIGRMCYPSPRRPRGVERRLVVFEAYGVMACLAAITVVALLKQRALAVSLLLSGVLRALCTRTFSVSYDYQSIFYVGVPLVLFWWGSNLVRRWGRRLLPVLLLVSIPAYLLSFVSVQAEKAAAAEWTLHVTRDFQVIRGITGSDKNILFMEVPHSLVVGHARDYYLSGNRHAPAQHAAFAISSNREYKPRSLTPDNTYLFLAQRVGE